MIQPINIPTLQSLTTITQESANDERVEEDPETICSIELLVTVHIYSSDVFTILFNGLLHTCIIII